MQSRPLEVSKTTSSNSLPQELQNRQHGVNHHDELSPHPFSSGEGGEPSHGASKANLDGHTATKTGEAVETPSRRLSAKNLSRDRSPANRITEYERALTPSPKNLSSGLGFKVVSRSEKPTTGTLGLADFPNGNPRSPLPS